MPIEIRELVIKTTIDNSGEAKGPSADKKDEQQGDIVRECVEQVMELLEQKKGR